MTGGGLTGSPPSPSERLHSAATATASGYASRPICERAEVEGFVGGDLRKEEEDQEGSYDDGR